MSPTWHDYSTVTCTNWNACKQQEMDNPLLRRWLQILPWPVSPMDRHPFAVDKNTFLQNELLRKTGVPAKLMVSAVGSKMAERCDATRVLR